MSMTDHVASFIRLKRPSTGSWLTFRLPEPVKAEALPELAEAVSDYAARTLPGWQVIAFSPADPEKGDGNE